MLMTPAAYSLDDTNGDTSFSSFNINRSPSYLFSVLKDIRAINQYVKVHIVPWSPVCPTISTVFLIILIL